MNVCWCGMNIGAGRKTKKEEKKSDWTSDIDRVLEHGIWVQVESRVEEKESECVCIW